MALFRYKCPQCDTTYETILVAVKEPPTCHVCKVPTKRFRGAPSVKVVERLDNGIMPKAVERLSETERLVKERNVLNEGAEYLADIPLVGVE